MSQRTLVRLLVAAAVLSFIWVLVSFLSRPGGGDTGSTGMTAFFDGIDPDRVDAIRIEGATGAIRLERVTGGWTVNGMRADSALVASFLDAMASAHVGSLVAHNPDNHARMGVSADSTTTVTLEADQQSSTVLLGKSGSGFGTVFARLPDEDDVYQIDGNIRSPATRTVEAWRNKLLASVDTASVARLRIGRNGGEYVVARTDSSWTLDGQAAADAPTVRNILAELADFRATGFLADADSVAMLPAERWVTALNAAGDTLAALTLGAGADTGDRWARARGDDVLYRVQSWRVDRLAPARTAVTAGS